MPPFLRILLLIVIYGTIAIVSYVSAWQVRFGFYPGIDGIPERFQDKWLVQGLYLIPFKLLCLYAFGQFTGMVRFFRMPDAIRLFLGSSLATSVCLLAWIATSYRYVPPGSILVVDFVAFTFLVMGARVGIRLFDERRKGFFRGGKKPQRVAIVGAGQAGSSLASEMISQAGLGMRPVAFFDDEPGKHGRSLHGVPIAGSPEEIPSYYQTHDLDKVVLAIPRASADRIRTIVSLLRKKRIPVETIPAIEELLSGHYGSSLTREVHIEDLLYRDPVKVDLEALRASVSGKKVLVTGAGGSIGSELALQISGLGPARLTLLDRNEGALFLTEKLLSDRGVNVPVEGKVVDLRDPVATDKVLSECQPDSIYHAAAHKHVGMMERQPLEAFLNNTIATLDLAEKAVRHGVASFCLISTDKAVEPSNVMGASKRLAELAVQAVIARGDSDKTAFSIVRFGNVIGSSGSVIPIFERQIAERAAVTVTDPAMTRYFMTIPEAVGLVLQAVAFGEKDQLFMLDMGEPVSIDAMARDLIRLKGLEPDVDIPIVYTGRQPGEKLEETVRYPEEALGETPHPKVHRLASRCTPVRDPEAFIGRLRGFAEAGIEGTDEGNRAGLFELLDQQPNPPKADI